ncbi:hypothetical protein [Pseudonocardia sp.]|uniref:hypothetical protein n=1 Tax=Pseudonocardia sp. TaxID=60912 RepID=UPI003D09A568
MITAHRVQQAVAIFDGEVAVPAGQRVVAAAQLARSGLELAIVEVLAARGYDLRRARLTSRLIVFTCLVGAELGATARLTWVGLTRACHRHAFELPPGPDEIRSLIVNVLQVIEGIESTA